MKNCTAMGCQLEGTKEKSRCTWSRLWIVDQNFPGSLHFMFCSTRRVVELHTTCAVVEFQELPSTWRLSPTLVVLHARHCVILPPRFMWPCAIPTNYHLSIIRSCHCCELGLEGTLPVFHRIVIHMVKLGTSKSLVYITSSPRHWYIATLLIDLGQFSIVSSV